VLFALTPIFRDDRARLGAAAAHAERIGPSIYVWRTPQ
jgi:hypothetical protein